jgi:type II secretory pathway component PulM
MAELSHGLDRHLVDYLQAQLDKISSALLSQQQELQQLRDMDSKMSKQARSIAELEKKVELLEVYQSQNFENN